MRLLIVRRFENAVTLRGNVADPGRFPWRAGMRISDVIPNKEYLLTRDYWKERNNLGARVTDSPATPPDPGPLENGQPQLVPAMAVTKTATPAPSQPPSYHENQRNTQGDTSLGAATGLDDAPPLRNFVPRNSIQPAAPEINWEYAVVERTDKETLASRIIPFNLGNAVLKRDPHRTSRSRRETPSLFFRRPTFRCRVLNRPNRFGWKEKWPWRECTQLCRVKRCGT